MTGWRIEAAGETEADQIAAIEAAAFGSASWGEKNVRDGLGAPYVFALVVRREDESEPKGFLMWRRLGDEAEILTFGVVEGARRQGAGDKLLDAALAAARCAGLKAMFLEVDAGNEAARGLYEKHGFSKVGERRGYYRSGADALILRKDLKVFPAGETA
ncbi:MAG TPA: GNAT family N-acetyltransferase [Parvularculaceae bacterium]|nr:GNAT family N-acetyltransferase [Parvularculaceae bacterium]